MNYTPPVYAVDLFGLIDSHKKIPAIKLIRKITGIFYGESYGLKESKAVVDAIELGRVVRINTTTEAEARMLKALLEDEFHTEPIVQQEVVDIESYNQGW